MVTQDRYCLTIIFKVTTVLDITKCLKTENIIYVTLHDNKYHDQIGQDFLDMQCVTMYRCTRLACFQGTVLRCSGGGAPALPYARR